jgi:TetR/AcrR family tetracycline transcriptional repressor
MARDGEATTRRRLSRERVVAAALRLVDRDGLEGLTMRALGSELGVDPMAVYHWVPKKDALLDLIVDAVFLEIPLDADMLPEGDWTERFGFASRVFRDTLLRHPNALPVLATRPAASPAAMKPVEFAMAILREAGFDPQTAAFGVSAMANLVTGLVLAWAGLPPGTEADVTDEERAALFQALDPEGFPYLTEALRTAEFDLDRQFEFGMDALMRGMEPLRSTDPG